MSNTAAYYNHTTYPANGAAGSAAAMRSELSNIEAGFNKLPTMSGNGNKLVKVSAAGTDLEVASVLSETGVAAVVAGYLQATYGVFTNGTVGPTTARQHTLPDVASDTVALLAAAQTLTNKTINLANNSLTGTANEFNAAVSDGSFSTTSGSETLTNKTMTFSNNTFSMTKAELSAAVSDGTVLFSGDVGAVAAGSVSSTTAGNITSTNVQDALAELDGFITANASNVAKTNQNNTFTVAQRGAIVTLSDASTVAVDLDTSNNFKVTLGGNRTLGNPSNLTAGQSGVIAVSQDATGSRTLAFHSTYVFEGGTAPVLSTGANKVDYLNYYVEATGRVFISAVLDVN